MKVCVAQACGLKFISPTSTNQNNRGDTHLNLQHCGGREIRIVESHWPKVSDPHSSSQFMNSRLRDPDLKAKINK